MAYRASRAEDAAFLLGEVAIVGCEVFGIHVLCRHENCVTQAEILTLCTENRGVGILCGVRKVGVGCKKSSAMLSFAPLTEATQWFGHGTSQIIQTDGVNDSSIHRRSEMLVG